MLVQVLFQRNILGVISPQKVILGGGVSRAVDLPLKPIVQTVNERVHMIPVEKVGFVLAELGMQGGLAGAALWAKCRWEGQWCPSERKIRSYE